MATGKIVLFYQFTPLADPEAIRLWQHTLAAAHGLTGRILISHQGINATVGGDIDSVKRYLRGTKEYPAFKNIDVKWSGGSAADFPRLSAKVRPEIVTFGAPAEVDVDATGVVGGGTKLTPKQLNELVAAPGGDRVAFFDGRNRIEAEIGRFRGAIVPPADTTRDFIGLLEAGEYDDLKDRPVVTYCTGGVRCEVLSALMVKRGFTQVYQLEGGIHRYGEEFGDDGLWEGSMYVFDRRMKIDFSDSPAILATCRECGTPTSRLANHPDPAGRELVPLCEACG